MYEGEAFGGRGGRGGWESSSGEKLGLGSVLSAGESEEGPDAVRPEYTETL